MTNQDVSYQLCSSLTKTQLVSLENLLRACRSCDLNTLPTYPHIIAKQRANLCIALAYSHNQLLGFAGAYYFYSNACEVALMVAPSVRKNTIARQLMKTLLPTIIQNQMAELIFSSIPKTNNFLFENRAFSYHESEYEMKRLKDTPEPISTYKLSIKKAAFQNLHELINIDNACFDTMGEDIVQRFVTILSDDTYQVLIGYYENQPIAKAHIQWLKEGAKLSDIAVLPKFQSKGFGKEIISYAINHLVSLNKVPISLDVLTKNKQAISLYELFGFQTTNHIDYWKIGTQQLKLD